MSYKITHNNQVITVKETVTNHDSFVNATSALLTFTFPAGITVLSGSGTQGSFNTGTGEWTIGTLGVLETETITMSIRIDDISLQPFYITEELTISQGETTIVDNSGTITLETEETGCDPCNFQIPVISPVPDPYQGMVIDVAKNDIAYCDCCTKSWIVEPDSSVNCTIINVTGSLFSVKLINPNLSWEFEYRVKCEDCSNGLSYQSDPILVSGQALFTASVGYYFTIGHTSPLSLIGVGDSENYFVVPTSLNGKKIRSVGYGLRDTGTDGTTKVRVVKKAGVTVTNSTTVTTIAINAYSANYVFDPEVFSLSTGDIVYIEVTESNSTDAKGLFATIEVW